MEYKNYFELFAISLHISIILFLPISGLTFIIYQIIYGTFVWRGLILAYITYIYYDHTWNYSTVCSNGWVFLRNNIIWRGVRSYFPIDLIKTADLPPDKNYIVACFPHGIIGFSITTNMSTDISKWLRLFPGVRPKVATLNSNLLLPFCRELSRAWGVLPVSREAITNILSKSNESSHSDNSDGFTSNAVAIVVGGAHEALDSRPGNYEITLKNRKGFVRIAIKTGSAIVPSFSFGEVDVYDQFYNPPKSFVRSFQEFFKKVTRLSPVFVKGRFYTILPYRKPITQVLGAPIVVVKNAEPTEEYVNEIHSKFVEAIVHIFETHKHNYIKNAKETKLVIH